MLDSSSSPSAKPTASNILSRVQRGRISHNHGPSRENLRTALRRARTETSLSARLSPNLPTQWIWYATVSD